MRSVLHSVRSVVVATLARRVAVEALMLLLGIAGLMMSLQTSSAATIAWKNTGTAYATNTNWIGDVAPATTDQALFQSGTTKVNPSIGNVTVDSLIVDNSGSPGNYTLNRAASGNTLTINPTATHAPNPATRGLSVTSGVTHFGSLTVPGKINMIGDQTWDIVGDLTLYGGNTNNAWTNTSARLTKTGAGTLTFNNQNSSGGVTGSSYGGTIGAVTIKAGTFAGQNGQINLSGTGTGTNAAVVMEGNTTLSFGLALDAPGSDQTVKFSGTSGTATLNGLTKTTTGSGARNLTFDIDNGSSDIDMIVGGISQFSGSGTPIVNMIKTGQGTLRMISGTSPYAGTTTLAKGQLLVGNNAPSGSAGAFGNSTTAVNVGVTGTTAATDNLSLLIDGGNFNIGRAITVNNFNSTGTTTLGVNTAHTGTFSGGVTLNTHSLQVYAAAGGTAIFSAPINAATGAPGINKIGDGTVVFGAANSYSGATNVMAGTLLANNTTGSATGTGTVTVQNGGTLGGTGIIGGNVTVQNNASLMGTLTINGNLTVQDGGEVTPGQSAGILSVGGSVTFDSGSEFIVEIGGTTPGVGGHDRLAVTGTANLGGSIDVSLTDNFVPAYNDQIIILTAGSINGTFEGLTNGAGLSVDGLNFEIYYTATQVYLTNFSIPEPSSAMLLGLGSLVLVNAQRRKRPAGRN